MILMRVIQGCTGVQSTSKPCSPGNSCIALGSVVLLAVGLVAQDIIYFVYNMGCHLWKDLEWKKAMFNRDNSKMKPRFYQSTFPLGFLCDRY